MYYYYYKDAGLPVRKDDSKKGPDGHSCPFCSDVYDNAPNTICTCPKCRQQRAEAESNVRQQAYYEDFDYPEYVREDEYDRREISVNTQTMTALRSSELREKMGRKR